MINWMLRLGFDDIIFIIILIIAIKVVRYWLKKIYSRIRQIAKILEYNTTKEV